MAGTYIFSKRDITDFESRLKHSFQHFLFHEEQQSPHYSDGYRRDSTILLLKELIRELKNPDEARETLGFDSTIYCPACLISVLDWAKISSNNSEEATIRKFIEDEIESLELSGSQDERNPGFSRDKAIDVLWNDFGDDPHEFISRIHTATDIDTDIETVGEAFPKKIKLPSSLVTHRFK